MLIGFCFPEFFFLKVYSKLNIGSNSYLSRLTKLNMFWESGTFQSLLYVMVHCKYLKSEAICSGFQMFDNESLCPQFFRTVNLYLRGYQP